MAEKYKSEIINLIRRMGEGDIVFLRQIYIVIKRHMGE